MRVCSRKRVDPMTRKRHRESRDLESREEVKLLFLQSRSQLVGGNELQKLSGGQ
jgi:hypothetical protein